MFSEVLENGAYIKFAALISPSQLHGTNPCHSIKIFTNDGVHKSLYCSSIATCLSQLLRMKKFELSQKTCFTGAPIYNRHLNYKG